MKAPSPQASRQVESGEHDSEHDPVQRISQVDAPEHDTLPLGPSVIAQVEPPAQPTLHDSPHVPLHWLAIAHDSVQLPPAHDEPSMSHALPASHAHDVPVHAGGGMSSPPQATNDDRTNARQRVRIPGGVATP